MLCTSLMYHKIRPFLIIILESENLRTWFIRVKQKPQILLVQSLPLHRKMEARRVSWLDQGDMCKYSPPRCLLLLPAQGMGRNTNVSMGGRSPWPGFASSELSFLILPLIGWCQSIFFFNLQFLLDFVGVSGECFLEAEEGKCSSFMSMQTLLLGTSGNVPSDPGTG